MLSAGTPASICFLISSAYQVTNFFLINFFADPLTVKSNGWKKCDTDTERNLKLIGTQYAGPGEDDDDEDRLVEK